MKLDTPILFVATTNPKKSRKFYEEKLGLKFISEDAFALVFRVGKLQLRIQKLECMTMDIQHTVLGWAVADIRKTVRRLAQAGVRFLRFEGMEQDTDGIWQSPAGARVAWFHDPDENILSLTEFPRS
jgi:catechol 2,3-dioxygenase-like lactoylglutathione lyase family enzyme